MRRVFLSLGSSRVRLGLGLLLACLLLTQIISTFHGNRLTASMPEVSIAYNPDGQVQGGKRLVDLAKTDHVALLKHALANYHRSYNDYTCTLTKLEKLGGQSQIGEKQVIAIKFKEDPFSVVMTWRVNPTRGDKMLYVENDPSGQHKMVVHPTGLAGKLIQWVERSPDDPEVLKSSLRSIKEFGFGRGMQSLISVYEAAKANGHLTEGYLGTGAVDGRPTLVLKRVLAAAEGMNYPAKTTIIEIDQEYLVPVHVKGTDWQDRPLCEYIYSDIRFNTGLKDADFTRDANKP